MPQEIGETYKSLVPSLSDDASIEKAFEMYHYGTAAYNGNNAQPQSMERHLVDINTDITDIRAEVSNLTNVFIEETSSVARPNIIVSENPTVVPLTLRGVENQTGVLQRWQKRNNAAYSDVAAISNNGNAAFSRYLTVGSNSFINDTALSVFLGGDDRGVAIRGSSGQTSNLQEWQNNSGSVLASVDASGNISIKNTTVTGDLSVSNNITVSNQSNLNDVTVGGTLSVTGETTISGDIFSTSDITANNITGNGDLSVIGSSSIHNLEVDGTINAFGTITASGDITTSGNFEGANISLTQSLITAGDITATGILRGNTPNSGSTGGVRIIANGVTNDNYLQFVDSTDTSEVSHIKVNASGFFLSSDTEIDGNLIVTGETNVLSPTGSGSVGVRQVYLSTGDPTASDGNNGDIWVKYI